MAKVNPAFLAQEPSSIEAVVDIIERSYHVNALSCMKPDKDALDGAVSEEVFRRLGLHAEEISISLTEEEQTGEYHMEEASPDQAWTGRVVLAVKDSGQIEDLQAEIDTRLTGELDCQDASGVLFSLELSSEG